MNAEYVSHLTSSPPPSQEPRVTFQAYKTGFNIPFSLIHSRLEQSNSFAARTKAHHRILQPTQGLSHLSDVRLLLASLVFSAHYLGLSQGAKQGGTEAVKNLSATPSPCVRQNML